MTDITLFRPWRCMNEAFLPNKMKYARTSQRRFDAVETSPVGAKTEILAWNSIQNSLKSGKPPESHKNSLYFDKLINLFSDVCPLQELSAVGICYWSVSTYLWRSAFRKIFTLLKVLNSSATYLWSIKHSCFTQRLPQSPNDSYISQKFNWGMAI